MRALSGLTAFLWPQPRSRSSRSRPPRCFPPIAAHHRQVDGRLTRLLGRSACQATIAKHLSYCRRMPSTEDYIEAGLYHPGPGQEGRLDLLQWLLDQGFTIESMMAANADGALPALANDWRTVPGPRLSRAEAIELAGVDPDGFDSFVRALGFTGVAGAPEGEIGVTADEARMLATFEGLGQIFSRDEAIGLMRVIGSSISRVGEAAVSLFLSDVESQMLSSGESELDLAQKGYDAVGLIDDMGDLFETVFRRHVLQATERTRLAEIEQGERFLYRYAVGFVDLVGFTEMSGAMHPKDLAVFLRDFEGRAHDVVTAVGARVVKLIGDEVMFVSTSADAACLAASELMEGFGTDLERVVPRGGLAYGDVLMRAGDYYGSVVNLAARLVNEAVPQELLVTEELALAAETCNFEPAGRRTVKGFADPITVRTFVST